MTDKTRMNLVLDAVLEERFRKAVFEKKGMKKGNISEAVEEAIEDWIDKSLKARKSG
ncbi:MAG TPA: hypothetical protein VGR53_05345 [Nitrososphaerales archaeon]|nr:hypothetical protein [Nitrososphaerales archaeon]